MFDFIVLLGMAKEVGFLNMPFNVSSIQIFCTVYLY